MKEEFKKRGVTNPVHDVVHDNVYVLEDDETAFLDIFYPFHYHKYLLVDTVRTFGDLRLLKYRAKGDSL